MLGFSPFKKRANKFNYTPRYYDPAKEAREQRRAEMFGKRDDKSDTGEYTPGQYNRTKHDARMANRREQTSTSQNKLMITVAVVVLLLLVIYLLYPRLLGAFQTANKQTVPTEAAQEEFNSATPIVIVPNDYQETE